QLSVDILVVDMFSPFDLKRLGVFSAVLRDLEPLVRKGAANAAKHAAIDQVPNRCFHYTPGRRRGKKHWLVCSEQRLKLWMNVAVKILKIFATMANHRTRERRPGFFGNFNGARDEKLVVRSHTSNIQHPTSNIQR